MSFEGKSSPEWHEAEMPLRLGAPPSSYKFVNEGQGSVTAQSPADKVLFILSPDETGPQDDTDIYNHTLFCQMNVLCHFDDGSRGWKETARWLKYEEKVEVGDRWSKPHVTTASLHALMEIRRTINSNSAVILLDINPSDEKSSKIVENAKNYSKERQKEYESYRKTSMDILARKIQIAKGLSDERTAKLLETLMAPHKHLHRGGQKPKSDEEGKNGRLPNSATETSIASLGDYPHMQYPKGVTPDDLKPYKPNKRLMKKVPGNTEAANILIGHLDFLTEPIMALVRLNNSVVLADMTEIAVPTRFIFIHLSPPTSLSLWEHEEVGRAAAALFTDKIFCAVAYLAANEYDLLAGIDEFIDDLTVLPPSVWDPSTRMEPPDNTISMNRVKNRLKEESRFAAGPEQFHQEGGASDDESLSRTGRLFGGLVQDVKRRYRQYWSDIRDAFHVQCIASIVFLYFACITPIVTFGGLLGAATDNYMGTMECILSGAVCGMIYHLFAGQPLTIVGSTGPMLVFEGILYTFCRDRSIDFLPFRLWIGLWTAFMFFLVVVFDLSALVRYITRFTEECFAVLISVIFIYEAIHKLGDIYKKYPVHVGIIRENVNGTYSCFCGLPASTTGASGGFEETTTNNTIFENIYNWTSSVREECITFTEKVVVNTKCISTKNCTEHGWELVGDACGDRIVTESYADIFFVSVILCLGTFVLAMFFRVMRQTGYFPTWVRTTFADFSVFLSIVVWTIIDATMGLKTPKLLVPDKFLPTIPDRGWLVNPFTITPLWYIALAVIPAFLVFILIFLDQQITAVIANRKEHKLAKGPGYHLDMLVITVLITICSILGIPWFVAATVQTIIHVRSLMKVSETSVPGEKIQIVGVREQRVTGFVVHLFIGVSVFVTMLLKYIPMPVLYGVFLYMGITSLGGVQFIDRIFIVFMPQKYQPDYIYLRHVDTKKVHLFTLLQIVCMAGMWAVKSISLISIAFPVMVLALCFARKALDLVYSRSDLYWLDHLLPEVERREKEDALSSTKHVVEEISEEERIYRNAGRPRRKSQDIIRRQSLKNQEIRLRADSDLKSIHEEEDSRAPLSANYNVDESKV